MRDQQCSMVESTSPGDRSRRSRIGLLVVAGASLSLVLAGCGTDNSAAPPPSPTPAGSPTPTTGDIDGVEAAVRWMDGFCGTVDDFLADNNNMQPPPEGATVEEIQQSTSTQLGEYAAILGKAVDGLSTLPPAPVPAAEAAKKTYLDRYTSARDKATSAKTQLDAAADDDIEAQGRAVDGLIAAQEDALSALDPVGAIINSPELSAAAATAPRCSAPGA